VHILLVEDDDRIAAALRTGLHRHGITTTRLSRGRGAVDHLAGVDVVLLDLGLPDIDGVDVCRAIREVSEVPVIVVSARGEVDDRILGLHSGADDYLVKPYDTGELVARVHAVRRRRRATTADAPADVVVVGDVSIDLGRHAVAVSGEPVNLTRKEFQVLALLAGSGGAVCTRSRIVAEVWGRSWAGANRTLDVHVATLRTKIGRPDLVQTVRGVGYRLGAAGATVLDGPGLDGPGLDGPGLDGPGPDGPGPDGPAEG
jgi:DNA-binding response OmpR family regulator